MYNKERYKRQIILPEIGIKGQKKISNASILVVGAGGLGCPALLYLTAAGTGHIGIIDFDNVDETNLQRQILFKNDHIGCNKAKTAAQELAKLNPNIDIEYFAEELNDKNIEKLFNRFDLIIDGSDNFATKFLINDAAIKTSTPFIYGSILGFNGQVSAFGASNYSPCYRCLFPSEPKDNIPNCAQNGVIGALAGIIGSTQAMEAIKLIVNHENFAPLTGKLWVIDMNSMENRLLSLNKDPNCPTCNKNKNDIKLNYKSQICNSTPEVTAMQAKEKTTALLIDVRERDEWDVGHIEGAQHIALSWLNKGNTPELPKDQEIIIYCQKGMRGEKATLLLKNAGFTNATNMIGGYEQWLKNNSK